MAANDYQAFEVKCWSKTDGTIHYNETVTAKSRGSAQLKAARAMTLPDDVDMEDLAFSINGVTTTPFC